MKITATTEANPQVIGYWGSYTNNNQWYQRIRLVGWISQNVDTLKTTLYFKWQVQRYNYYPYWNEGHNYSVTFGGVTKTVAFKISDSQVNGIVDACPVQSITVSHNSSTGAYTGTLTASGYKCWEAISGTYSIEFPTISTTTPVTPEPEPPTPIVEDTNPRYFIYADDELVYAAGVEGYEIINPKLTLELNKAGSLTFDIPVGSAMYNKLNLMKTTIECRQGTDVLFRGRVLNTKRNIYNTLTYYCEGFLSWLVDIIFQPYTFTGQARDLLKDFLTRYNTYASSNRQITYQYSDISANIAVDVKDYSTAWAEIKRICIDGVNGYIVPYLTSSVTGIQWLSSYGTNTRQFIQFGENLLDFSQIIDASEIFTAVKPLGKEINGTRVSLTESFVKDDDAIAIYGRIERTVIFDEVTTESDLRTVATAFLRTGLSPVMALNISAIDLHVLNPDIERIRVGDSIRVISVPHEVDAYFICTKANIDLQDASKTVFTLGSTQKTISELTDTSVSKYVITEGV